MSNHIQSNTEGIGDAAAFMAMTGSLFFTSDEYVPAVVICDRSQECEHCGSALPCPWGDHEERDEDEEEAA